jgi:hypothetical protein
MLCFVDGLTFVAIVVDLGMNYCQSSSKYIINIAEEFYFLCSLVNAINQLLTNLKVAKSHGRICSPLIIHSSVSPGTSAPTIPKKPELNDVCLTKTASFDKQKTRKSTSQST